MRKTDTGDAPPLKRCAIYTRKSVEEGLDMEFNSLDAQRDASENYILSQKGKGWTCLPTRYDDGGFSGGNMNRPALTRLLADCEAGLVDVIVVYKIDRLSRSICDFADLSKKFDKWNVSFCSVTQDINTATSSGRMMLNILVTFAQYEREIIGERIRDKMEATRRKGLWTGGVVAIGYRLEDHRLVPEPVEAEVVRRIFRRYAEVQSARQVARELNEAGVRTRQGYEWNKPRVYRVLGNPTYIGKIASGGRLYDGAHEPIIEQALWDKVHEFLEANTRDAPDKTVRSADVAPLKGILRCGHCGGPMMTYTRTKKGKVYTYYRCVNDAKRAVPSCPMREIAAPVIEKLVFAQVSRAFASPGVLASLSEATGTDARDILASLDGGFWEEATRPEARRIMELLLAGATLHPDRLELEVNIDGIEQLEKEIEDGQNDKD